MRRIFVSLVLALLASFALATAASAAEGITFDLKPGQHPNCSSPTAFRLDWFLPQGVTIEKIEEWWTWTNGRVDLLGEGGGSRAFWESRSSICIGFSRQDQFLLTVTVYLTDGQVISRSATNLQVPCKADPAGRKHPVTGQIYYKDGSVPKSGTVSIETCNWRYVTTVPLINGRFEIPAALIAADSMYRINYVFDNKEKERLSLDGTIGYTWNWFSDATRQTNGILEFQGIMTMETEG